MKVLKRALIVLAVLVGLFVIIGLMLPGRVHLARSVEIDAPASQVYPLIDGYQRFNEWSPWANLDPATRYEYSGPERGVGARMEWQSDSREVGAGAQEIISAQVDRSVRTRLTFEGQGEAEATMELEPTGSGTLATWSLEMDLGLNPVTRWIGLMIEGPVGADYERGLAQLKALAEREAAATPPAETPATGSGDAGTAPPIDG